MNDHLCPLAYCSPRVVRCSGGLRSCENAVVPHLAAQALGIYGM